MHKAIIVDPTIYNINIALAYAYLEKKDYVSAAEFFAKELEYHPDSYQAACDLVALYAEKEEWYSALSWMKKAISINPETTDYFEKDVRLLKLQKVKVKEFNKVIESGKRQLDKIT